MSNVEVRYSVYFMKMKERSDTTLRNSVVRYSKFCGSLFKSDPAIEAVDLIQMDTSIYGVSYERFGVCEGCLSRLLANFGVSPAAGLKSGQSNRIKNLTKCNSIFLTGSTSLRPAQSWTSPRQAGWTGYSYAKTK